jgi:hypothetical protein
VNSVGADKDVAGRGASIRERNGDAVVILIEALDATTEMETSRFKAAKQNIKQVGPVRGVIRRTKMCFRPLAERRVVETITVVPGTIVPSLRIIRA